LTFLMVLSRLFIPTAVAIITAIARGRPIGARINRGIGP
jgi:hypothetical protein